MVKLQCEHIYWLECLLQWLDVIDNDVCSLCQQEIDWSKTSNLKNLRTETIE